jgi:hypothetical protein
MIFCVDLNGSAICLMLDRRKEESCWNRRIAILLFMLCLNEHDYIIYVMLECSFKNSEIEKAEKYLRR